MSENLRAQAFTVDGDYPPPSEVVLLSDALAEVSRLEQEMRENQQKTFSALDWHMESSHALRRIAVHLGLLAEDELPKEMTPELFGRSIILAIQADRIRQTEARERIIELEQENARLREDVTRISGDFDATTEYSDDLERRLSQAREVLEHIKSEALFVEQAAAGGPVLQFVLFAAQTAHSALESLTPTPTASPESTERDGGLLEQPVETK